MIVLKTDASFKHDVGSGVSFDCKIVEGGMERRSLSDNSFISDVSSSTDAELLAVLFGVKKTVEKISQYEEYEITVNSDCQYIQNVFNKNDYQDNPVRKVIVSLLQKFSEWRVKWIPRSVNSTADGLAKSALDRAERNNE